MTLSESYKKRLQELSGINNIEEGWKQNLAAGLALTAGVLAPQKSLSQNASNNNQITQTQETQSQKIERMERIGSDHSIKDGFGTATSPSQSTALKMASFNAKQNIIQKGGNISGLTIKEEVITINQNGQYTCYIILGKING